MPRYACAAEFDISAVKLKKSTPAPAKNDAGTSRRVDSARSHSHSRSLAWWIVQHNRPCRPIFVACCARRAIRHRTKMALLNRAGEMDRCAL